MNEFAEAFRTAGELIWRLDAQLVEIIALSMRVSLTAVAAAALVGLPLGALLAVARFPGRRAVVVFLNASMGLPPVVVGLVVYLLLSRSGPLGALEWLFNPPALILVLDAVQDPRNFGACLRVADGAGVDAVVYPRDKSARLGDVVAKAASGAIDTVRLTPVANLAAALRELRDAGVWITGADGEAEASIYDIDFSGPAALVFGNEGRGLRRLTREHCDTLASIPMAGELESLNVATAVAGGLFEARRQR